MITCAYCGEMVLASHSEPRQCVYYLKAVMARERAARRALAIVAARDHADPHALAHDMEAQWALAASRALDEEER